jgi:hypothetical protein
MFKIIITDAVDKKLAEFTITDEQVKALSTDMISSNPNVVFLDWLQNAIQNKARQCIDQVCEDALNDQTNTILTITEKQEIVSGLAKSGRIITTVKQMPQVVKDLIVQKARVKTAAKRQAEFEASMHKTQGPQVELVVTELENLPDPDYGPL